MGIEINMGISMDSKMEIGEEFSLTPREKSILQSIIHLYILKASPVGSRNLSKLLEKELKLSPATIRNVMADLEERQLICHPHTSAGRIPTDKGYRFYVDSLLQKSGLTETEIQAVRDSITASTTETVLRDASRILGMLSHYLGVVEIPLVTNLIVIKLELIRLSANHFLVVLALDSNIIRTITLEAELEEDLRYLEDISRLINERISGKPLRYLKENFKEMLSDTNLYQTPLLRLFFDSADKIFELHPATERIHFAGTQNLIAHPEFDDLEKVRGVIELVENEDIIIHILESGEFSEIGTKVLIGSEMQNRLLDDYALVASNYKIGSANGTIGLIGPKRMNYAKMMALVKHVSELISEDF